MKRVGVIDICSNYIRVILSEIEDSGYFRVIDELSEPVKLALDLIDNNFITEEKVNITINTLRAFKSLCVTSGATKIIVVATEALRDADNGEYIIEKISSELNLDVKILTLKDEIYYNYMGVKNSIYTTNSLLIDISGTCTHLAWVKNGQIIESTTLPIGSLNISYGFNLRDRIIHSDFENAKSSIMDCITSIPWLKKGNFDNIIGVGGAFRNVGKIDRIRKRYPLLITHNYELTNTDLCEILNLLKSKDLNQRIKVDGVSKDRVDIIVGTTLIMKVLTYFLDITQLKICGRGMREGLLFDYIIKNLGPIDDIVDYSIRGIMESLNVNKDHAEHVYTILKTLYEQLRPLHHLGNEYDNVIKTASLLHDSGISIKYYNHHIHSFYVILNAYMNGLTHKELLLSACTAAFHRNNSYTVPLAQYSSIINRLDVDIVEKIGILLRISESLDRSLEGAVKYLDVKIADEIVSINVYSSIPLELEIRDALRSRCKFKEIYHKELDIQNIVV